MSAPTAQKAPVSSLSAPSPRPRRTSPVLRFLTLEALDRPGIRDLGLLVLRLGTLGIFLHGLHKATAYAGFHDTVAHAPIGSLAPGLFALMVVVGQLVLGFTLATGLFTRWSGFFMALMFVFIIVLFNLPNGLIDARTGGISFESSLFYFVPAITLLLTGPGRISLDHLLTRRA